MENKQTAVEWLTYKIEEQRENGNVDLRTTLFYCEQAKEMEKEQIIDAHNNGYGSGYMDEGISPEKFYNETYGNNK